MENVETLEDIIKISLDDLVKVLRQEGLRVSKRNLSYWVKDGLLSSPERVSEGRYGSRGFYPLSVLERIRYILRLKGLNNKEKKERLDKPTLEIIEIPGYSPLEVVEVEKIKSSNGKIRIFKHFRYGGFAITISKEERK